MVELETKPEIWVPDPQRYLHCLQSKPGVTIVHSLFEWNGCVIHVWVYLQLRNDSLIRDLFSEKSLTQFRCAMQQLQPNLSMLPFSCLLPLVCTYLCEQGWILLYTSVSRGGYCYIPLWARMDIAISGKAKEKRAPRFTFFLICHGYFLRVSHLVFAWFCFRP